MHFINRQSAGQKLANQLLADFRYEDCVVLALNIGGVLVGSQIAQELCSPLLLLLEEEIFLPHEPISVGGITSEGNFVYNDKLIPNESSEILQEYRGVIEEEKLSKIREMTALVGDSFLAKKELIKYRNVILTIDGLKGDLLLKLAYDFLKPLKIKNLIVATPIADVSAVDWMHANADKIFCLWVNDDNDFDVNRYFDDNQLPDLDKVIGIIENIVLNWKN
jgi:predicted phosphoribosyltransferase